MQAYSDPTRENDEHALPDIEVFQLTSEEAAEFYADEDTWIQARQRFPLCDFNSRDRQKAIRWVIAQTGDGAGWYWWSCFPGCLPDSDPIGPFETQELALADAQEHN